MWRLFFISCLLISCYSYRKIQAPPLQNPITGSAFYMQYASCNWHRRDSLAVKALLEGNMPSFLKRFVPVYVKITSAEGKNINAVYYVSPDYLSIGWHLLNGEPIQPLYTGHVSWYVDYGHGIRLVYRKIKVNGKWMDYKTVFQNKTLRQLICDEGDCNFYRYDTVD